MIFIRDTDVDERVGIYRWFRWWFRCGVVLVVTVRPFCVIQIPVSAIVAHYGEAIRVACWRYMRLSQPVCTLVDAPRNRCTLRAAPLDRCITKGSAPQTPCTASLRCSLLDYGMCYIKDSRPGNMCLKSFQKVSLL